MDAKRPRHAGRVDSRQGIRQQLVARGWARVPGVLAPSSAALSALVAQVEDELVRPSVPPESGTPRVVLSDPNSWPCGGSRRVIECVPPGTGVAHWEELVRAPRLVAALDEVLGPGCWELPVNSAEYLPDKEYIRQWYAPIVFPETSASQATAPAPPEVGDEEGWRNGEGEGWTAEEDRALLAARSVDGQVCVCVCRVCARVASCFAYTSPCGRPTIGRPLHPLSGMGGAPSNAVNAGAACSRGQLPVRRVPQPSTPLESALSLACSSVVRRRRQSDAAVF